MWIRENEYSHKREHKRPLRKHRDVREKKPASSTRPVSAMVDAIGDAQPEVIF